MMKRTVVAIVSICIFGEGCIAQSGDMPEQSPSTAQPAESLSVADMPSSPSSGIQTPSRGRDACRDSCLEQWSGCSIEADTYALCLCTKELDRCLRECGVVLTDPCVCDPPPPESERPLEKY
jgi:hypothetical protein